MQTWLRAECGIEAAYRTVHQLVRYQLQAKLKVPRPTSIKLSVAAIEELKKLPQQLESILSSRKTELPHYQKVRFWCEDETRIGLKTIFGPPADFKGGQASWKNAVGIPVFLAVWTGRTRKW